MLSDDNDEDGRPNDVESLVVDDVVHGDVSNAVKTRSRRSSEHVP